MQKVSIVIPAYNEEAFIGKLLDIILSIDLHSVGFEREIIVIDDGSTDATFAIASAFQDVICLHQDNQGKGSATKHGIRVSTGDWILIQDADLEYDPHDYIALLRPLQHVEQPMAVYGSRILGEFKNTSRRWRLFPGKHPEKSLATWIVNIFLSCWAYVLYGTFITDTLTGYKVYPTNILKRFTIRTFGFETDHELTSKLLRSGVRILEVPVAYSPRSVADGKKIRALDFFIAIWTFFKFRFVPKSSF